MNEKEIREIDRFDVSSEDGRVFTIVVYQNFIISHPHGGATSRIPGLKKAETTEGYHVNHKDDDTFHIVELDLIVTRIKT